MIRKILHIFIFKRGFIFLYALFWALFTLIPSYVLAQPIIHELSPNAVIETSEKMFTLQGLGLSSINQIVIFGSPPKTKWQIPSIVPNKSQTNISAIKILGTKAYLIEDSKTLHILDLTIPDQPRRIGTLTDNRFIDLNQIWVTDQFLYLTDYGYGIWVVDISDPNHPSLLGNGEGNYSFHAETSSGIFVKGNIIYTTNWLSGIQILEQDSKGQINFLRGASTTGFPYDIVVKDNFAYVSVEDTVEIFDLKNLGNPASRTVIPAHQIPNESFSIRKTLTKDNLLYIMDRDNGIYVADLSNPATPQIFTSFRIEGQLVDLVGELEDMILFGSYVIVANSDDGIQIIDFHDKKNPTILGSVDTFGDAKAIAFYDSYIYVANGYAGLSIIEAPSLTHPNLQACLQTDNIIEAIASKGDYAFVSNNTSGLRIIRTSPSWQPEVTATIVEDGIALHSLVKEKKLFLADGKWLKIFDITNPTNPVFKGEENLFDPIMAISVSGDYAYIANLGFGAISYNVENPTNMILGGIITPRDGYPNDIVFDQGLGYFVSHGFGLWIVDFTTPDFPITRSELYQFNKATSLKKYKNFIYLANGNNGMERIDVSDPDTPFLIETIDYNDSIIDVEIEFPFLYTVGGDNGIWINHLTSIGDITPLTGIHLPSGGSAVKSNEDLLYCGDDHGNFYIFSTPILANIFRSSDSEITFWMDRKLPAGFYDIFLINSKTGEVWTLERGLTVYQNSIQLTPGMNIFSYPGLVPPQNAKAFSLLINLAQQTSDDHLRIEKILGLNKSLEESESFHLAYLDPTNQPLGENFDIISIRGYPLYTTGTQQKTYLLSGQSLNITETELIEMLRGEITPGRTLISMPVSETVRIEFSNLTNSGNQTSDHTIQEWDPQQGKWRSGYHFFGNVSGKVQDLKGGRGYLIYQK